MSSLVQLTQNFRTHLSESKKTQNLGHGNFSRLEAHLLSSAVEFLEEEEWHRRAVAGSNESTIVNQFAESFEQDVYKSEEK